VRDFFLFVVAPFCVCFALCYFILRGMQRREAETKARLLQETIQFFEQRDAQLEREAEWDRQFQTQINAEKVAKRVRQMKPARQIL
jgi:predicted Holliday junction resolvase-like endonuclease